MHYLIRKMFLGFSCFAHEFSKIAPGLMDMQIRCEEYSFAFAFVALKPVRTRNYDIPKLKPSFNMT